MRDDLISRKAAIDRIKRQMKRPDSFGLWAHDDKIAEVCYGIAIEILENLPSAEPEWILCEEALPKQEGWYLVTNDAGGVTTVEMSWYDGFDSPVTPFWELDNPIAWMPLPEPYNGGERE